MRREGMYTSELYVQSTKTYYGGRKAWKSQKMFFQSEQTPKK